MDSVYKTKISQKIPKKYENNIISFHRCEIQQQKMNDFEMEHKVNMDNILLTFDIPSNRTVAKKGKKKKMVCENEWI